jgi:hypothetical protein
MGKASDKASDLAMVVWLPSEWAYLSAVQRQAHMSHNPRCRSPGILFLRHKNACH